MTDMLRNLSEPQTAEAPRDWVALYGPRVLGICQQIIPAEAGEAFTAVFATVGANPGRMPHGADPAHWLGLLARHEALGRRRAEEDAQVMRLPAIPPYAHHQAAIDTDMLDRALAKLEPACREILRRMWINGDDYARLSQDLNLQPFQIRDALHRAVEFIHDEVWAPLDHETAGLQMLAAEYALGVLSIDDAGEIERMMTEDDSLQAAVAGWGRCFARLSDELPQREVDPALMARAMHHLQTHPEQNFRSGLRGILRTTIYAVFGSMIVWVLWFLWP